jgi:hypothetical protein
MRFRKSFSLLLLLLFVSFLGYFLFDYFQGFNSKTHLVILKESGFEPKELTIQKGDIVQFKTEISDSFWPASDIHPTHGIYPEFDPQEPIEPSQTWSFRFNKEGSWKFHDHLQPVFRGIITVQ